MESWQYDLIARGGQLSVESDVQETWSDAAREAAAEARKAHAKATSMGAGHLETRALQSSAEAHEYTGEVLGAKTDRGTLARMHDNAATNHAEAAQYAHAVGDKERAAVHNKHAAAHRKQAKKLRYTT